MFVDDQSVDLSYEFAKMYERKYPDKMKVLRTEEKKRAGGARNLGMDFPVGCEYLYFMDSDDYLYSPCSLQTMKDAVGGRPGLVLFDWYVEKGGRVGRCSFGDFEKYRRENRLAQTPWNAAWTRLVRSDLAAPFLENCMRGEDTYQMLQILDKNPAVRQVHDAAYVYRLHGGNTVLSEEFEKDGPVFRAALEGLRAKMKSQAVLKSIDRRLGR